MLGKTSRSKLKVKLSHYSFYRNAEVTEKFNQLDADQNGVLSPDEVIKCIKQNMGFNEEEARYGVKVIGYGFYRSDLFAPQYLLFKFAYGFKFGTIR